MVNVGKYTSPMDPMGDNMMFVLGAPRIGARDSVL